MIEFSWSWSGPWWIVPLYIGCLTLMLLLVFGAIAWWDGRR